MDVLVVMAGHTPRFARPKARINLRKGCIDLLPKCLLATRCLARGGRLAKSHRQEVAISMLHTPPFSLLTFTFHTYTTRGHPARVKTVPSQYMNRFKKKKKQEQLKAAEEQSRRSLPPAGHHDEEGQDYLSGAFVDEPPISTSGSKRTAEPPPPQTVSKKAKAENAAEKLQEGMNTPLSQVEFPLLFSGQAISARLSQASLHPPSP